jgi:hypothetical protein
MAGEPAYTVKGKNGLDRPTTLRDARLLNLVPSVTTIIKCAAAPGLEQWKRNQVLLAALTLNRTENESEASWLERVEQDWQEHGRSAAERGTAIHAAVQGHFEGKPPDMAYWPQVNAARDCLAKHCGPQKWVAEASFANSYGYGGKCDLHSPMWVVDFKSKEFTADDPPDKLWDEHLMQLHAYRRGLQVPTAKCAICYVSSTCEAAAFLPADLEDLERGGRMFLALLHFWQAKTGYRPTWVS